MNYKKTGECKEAYPKIPIALVLKKKNRERLENWYAEKTMDDLDCYSCRDFWELGMWGLTGAKELTDGDLVLEFKMWADNEREQRGSYPIISKEKKSNGRIN